MMMKAAQYKENSSEPNALEVVNVPIPKAGPEEVVVKVHYAALNPVDLKVMAGHLKDVGWAMDLPFTPGYDFSGTVSEVGSGVASAKVGDEVLGLKWFDDPAQHAAGTCAEYVSVKANQLVKKPAGLSFRDSAALVMCGQTAHQMMFDCLKVSSGQKVLICGGAGAVGMCSIQMAKAAGAWVATTASARTKSFVEALGPDKIIDYTKNDWAEDPDLKNIDAVFDATGGEKDSFVRAKSILKSDGSYVAVGAMDAGFDPTAHPPLKFAAWKLIWPDASAVESVVKMVLEGKVKVAIEAEFPLTTEGARDAMAKVAGGKSMGKVVLKVA